MDPSQLAGAGSSAVGAILGFINQRAALNEQKRQYNTGMIRKNAMLGAALPGMLNNLGYDPAMVPGMAGNILGRSGDHGIGY